MSVILATAVNFIVTVFLFSIRQKGKTITPLIMIPETIRYICICSP